MIINLEPKKTTKLNFSKHLLAFILVCSFLVSPLFLGAQFVTVGPFTECSSSPDVIDLDRNDYGGPLSEGYLHNFSVPPETSCGTSEIISAIVEISINSIDASGLMPPCFFLSVFGNVLIDAAGLPFGAGCCAVSQDVLTPGCFSFGTGAFGPTTESLDLVMDCGEFIPMGGTIGVDIIGAINGDPSCPASPISSGDLIIDYNICVTFEVAIPQEPTVDAGPDITIDCITPGLIGADPVAPDWESGWAYEWDDPSSQNGTFSAGDNGQINVMPMMTEIYTVTVTGSGGCTDTDEVEVTYDCCPDPGCDDSCGLTTDTWDDTACMCVFDPPDPDDGCSLTTDSYDDVNCMIINDPPNVDDGCPLTTDSFDDVNCMIVNDPPTCDDGCPLTTDSFDAGSCTCLNDPPNVDDGCPLTMDSWDAANCMVVNEPPSCDDGCPLTIDSFDAGSCTCLNDPPNVDDGCALTTDIWDALNCMIINDPPDCDDGCPATTDDFDFILCQCFYITPDCDDGCPLTVDSYNAVTCLCENIEPDPDDGCPLTVDSFDPINCEIVNDPPDCEDFCPLTTDFYDDVNCQCFNIEPDIDDGCALTVDSFDDVNCEIINDPPDCDDGCPQTVDSFDDVACMCINDPPDVDDGCSLTNDFWDQANCIVINEPPDCDDNDCSTSDFFDLSACECVNDVNVNCDDGCDLTTDTYDLVLCDCVFTAPDPDDGCALTMDIFNDVTCEIQNIEPDCDDNDCATADSFDAANCMCINDTNINCDDGCALTVDTYDPVTCDCVFSAPDPDDGCALTVDSFDAVNCMIVNEAPDCDDNDCSTADSFDFTTCMCVNDTNVNCDDGCPLTTDTYDLVLCDCVHTGPDPDDGCPLTMDVFDEVNCLVLNIPMSCDDGCDLTTDSFDFILCTCINEEPDCDDGDSSNGVEIYDEANCECIIGTGTVSVPDVTDIFWCEGNPIPGFVVEFPGPNLTPQWYDDPIGPVVISTDFIWIPPGPGTYYVSFRDDVGQESDRVEVVATEVANPAWSNLDFVCDPITNTYTVSLEFDDPMTSISNFNGITFVGTLDGVQFVMDQGVDMVATFSTMVMCQVDFTFEAPDCDCNKFASVNDEAFLPCDGSALTLENELPGPTIPSLGDVFWEDIDGNVISNTGSVDVMDMGQYVIVSYDANGDCFIYDTIDVLEAPLVELMVDTAVGLSLDCALSMVSFEIINPVENVVYSWTQGLEAEEALFFETSNVGDVLLLGFDTITMCSEIEAFVVDDITSFPEINFESVSSIDCVTPMVTIDASNSENGPDFTHQWYDISGTPIDGETELTLEVDEGGMYVFETINEINNCASLDTILVEDFADFPAVNAGGDLILNCDMLSLDLDGSNGTDSGAEFDVMWSSIEGNMIDNETGLTPTIFDPGTYVLQVTNSANGCVETDTVIVELDELSGISFELTDPNCLDLDGGVVEVFSQSTTGLTFTLDSDTNDIGVFENLESGTYNLMIESPVGCTLDTMITIEPVDVLDVQLAQAEFIVFEEETIQLDLTVNRDESEIVEVSISPMIAASCELCFNPILSGFPTGEYQLTMIDENGCMDVVGFTIIVRPLFSVYVPNVFNMDDGTGNFTIYSKDPVNINSMSIYDRWGNRVFNSENFPTNDPSFGWDGRHQGQDVGQGVYILQVEYVDDTGEVQFIHDDLTVLAN